MSVNESLAGALERLARLLELSGEDPFRVNAHARAARTISALPEDLRPLSADRQKLTAIEGVGPKLADKIVEFCATGRLKELDDLLAKVPPGLPALLDLPGLGPKTVRTLWKEGGVTDVSSLRRIIDSGEILKLPRMGAKSVEKIRASLEFMSTVVGRLALGVALPAAERAAEAVRAQPGVRRVDYAGSLRRGRDTIGDIDLLCASDDAGATTAAFRAMPGVARVLASGETRSSVLVHVGADGGRWGGDETSPAVQIDLKIVPADRWGAAMLYFTGSKDHNVHLRERARELGFTLNEYGLFPLDDDPEPPHRRGVRPAAAGMEEDVYRELGLPFIPPEIRENLGEFGLKETPALLEVGQIRAELHAHTTASDGRLSIVELARCAIDRGFHTIAVTDHSRSSAVAGGLTPERLREHVRAVREADARVEGIRILAGSEVDILSDGSLDYDDDLLAELDIVVASPHAALSQDPAGATSRLLRAVRHPLVHILGHPTGRLINRRKGLEPAMDEIVAAASEHRTALEINAHWMRLDLRDRHVHAAVNAGCVLAVNCDVHDPADFDNLRYGVLTARRGWLTPGRCLNAWPASKLHAWLRAKR